MKNIITSGRHPQVTAHNIGQLAMIWAQDSAGILGADGQMVWHVPADFQFFKATTMGCPVIHGRTSFAALGYRPLPGRRNIVLTSADSIPQAPDNIDIAHSLDAALTLAAGSEQVWIAGGAHVYTQALPYADLLVVTILDYAAKVPAGAKPVYAPVIPTEVFTRDESRSDTQWREKSGDSRWRVEYWQRHGTVTGSD